MATYLLAWNPKKWRWGNLEQELASVRDKGQAQDRWSCGNNKRISIGSRFFLIRLGQEPKGIVGSARIVSRPFSDKHWQLDRASLGEKGLFVEIEFSCLFKEPLVALQTLQRPPFQEFRWSTQMSGIRIREPIAQALEAHWQQKLAERHIQTPGEIEECEAFFEGALRQTFVNAYERDSSARAACIGHYGTRCQVCEFEFEESYGQVAAGFIQVHHLTPLSDIKKSYVVNPSADLIPVCPNCHAVIHMRKPPYKPEEVKEFLRLRSRSDVS